MRHLGLASALLLVPLLAACHSRAGGPAQSKQRNTATSAEWSGTSASTVEELFAGRFPGVQVFSVPGGISVRIRGAASVMGSGEPLYVLDGQTLQSGPGGALMGINPADIAKIEVLKDIGSTAIYGVQGANGVVLITTRRGRQ
jgi:TonB-dependent starch-binding outer membrane protein SusC